jgi:hypothetical protein
MKSHSEDVTSNAPARVGLVNIPENVQGLVTGRAI